MLLYIFILTGIAFTLFIVIPVVLAILMALAKLLLVIFATFWKVILISFVVVSLLMPVPLLWLYALLLYLIIKFMEGE